MRSWFFWKAQRYYCGMPAIIVAFMLLLPGIARADVQITAASGGANLCVDGDFATLGDLVLTEQDDADFSTGTGVSFILKLPTGFVFNQSAALNLSTSGGDLGGLGYTFIDADDLRITFDVNSVTGSDILTISGIQVKSISPAASGNMTRSGGDAVIAGFADGTACGPLSGLDPPEITQNPASLEICAGATASFTSTANGSALTYQWQVDTGSGFADISAAGAPGYSGFNSATLNIANSAGLDGYAYRCIVTESAACDAVSNTAVLTVNALPSGTLSGSATICAGSSTNLSFSLSGGTAPYDAVYTDGTSNYLLSNIVNGHLEAVSPSATTTYSFVSLTDDKGCAATSPGGSAIITVNIPPAITAQPQNVRVCADDAAVFTVNAGATTAPTYQWQVSTNGGGSFSNLSDGAPYSGVNSASLTVSPTSSAQDGYLYRCIVGGTCAPPTVTSNSAQLTVDTEPQFTLDPVNTTACESGTAVLNATATGTNLSYQWQEFSGGTWSNLANGGFYSGVLTNSLNISGITSVLNGRQYRLVASNNPPAICAVNTPSAVATLTVQEQPEITGQPTSQIICQGGNTSFTVNAGATTSPGFQWQVSTNGGLSYNDLVNGGVYSGVNLATLSISGATTTLNGYLYRCRVSGACTPPVTSNAAQLTVAQPVSISTNPVAAAVCEGQSVSFSVTAAGTSPAYQWQEFNGSTWGNLSNGGVYSGVNTATLTLTGVSAALNSRQYRVVVSNGAPCNSSETSAAAVLTVRTLPLVTTQPVIPGGVCENDNLITISVSGTGTGLTYQWQESTNDGASFGNLSNGGVYSGVSTPTLTLTDVPLTMNGRIYRAVLSGTCPPPAISSQVPITVNPTPSFTITNSTPIVCEGSPVDLLLSSATPGAIITLDNVNYNGAIGTLAGGETYASGSRITESISNPTEATITVTYTFSVSANGCGNPATQQTTVQVRPIPSFSIDNAVPSICAGTQTDISLQSPTGGAVITLTSVNYGLAGGTLSGGETYTNGQKIQEVLTNGTSATQVVTYTFRASANSCVNPVTQSAQVSVKPIPNAAAVAPIICSGEVTAIQITNPNGVPFTTFNWVVQSAAPEISGYASGSGTTIAQLLVNSSGSSKSLTYRITPTSQGCDGAFIDVVQTVSAGNTANAGSDVIVCEGTPNITIADASVGGGATFPPSVWSVVNGTGTLSGENTITPTYTPSVGEIGTVTLRLRASDGSTCPDALDFVNIDIIRAAFVSAGADKSVCFGDVFLVDAAQGGSTTSVTWTGGLGTFLPNANTLNAVYRPAPSEIGTVVTLTITTDDPPGTCGPATDNVDIFFEEAPTVFAGTDVVICEGSGSVTIADATIGGGATFPPSIWKIINGSGTLDNAETITPTYNPAFGEIGTITLELTASGSGPCPAAVDYVDIQIIRETFVSAGADKTVCQGSDVNLIDAAIGGSTTSVTWTGGAGTYIPNANTLNAIYRPAASEAGTTVVLTITTNDPPGPCGPSSDQVAITIEPRPVVFAGADKVVCEGDVVSLIDATASGPVGSVTWSGGSGTFLPSNTTLNAIYVPAPAEIGTTVTLTLTSDDPAGPCGAASDQVAIAINKAPEVFAGTDQAICEGQNILIGDATIGGTATSVTWSGGTGTYTPNNTTLNVIYAPAPSEIGTTVILTLTTNDPAGPCIAASDQVAISVGQAAVVSAGTDKVTCESDPVSLSDASTGGSTSSVTWSGGLGSFTPNAQTLNASYIPAPAEVGTTVTLTLASNDPAGVCPATSDQVSIVVNRRPTVDAGADRTVCENSSVVLSGTIGGSALFGTWTSSGDGTFSFAGDLSATYTPGPGDITNGTVILTLTTDDPSGPCAAVSDDMVLTVDRLPIAFAGNDQIVCEGTASVTVSDATIGGGATFPPSFWTVVSGNGTLLDGNTISPTYLPAPGELGNITLRLSASNGSACPTVTDFVDIQIIREAFVFAGADQEVCFGQDVFLSDATISGSATGATWSGGAGTFFPDPNTVRVVYRPVASEIGTTVQLILTSNDPPGTCGVASDTVEVTIGEAPIANAGSDIVVCEGSGTITVPDASVSGGATFPPSNWSIVNGSGSLTDANTITPTYSPLPGEIGTITLQLTAAGSSACPSDLDYVEIQIIRDAFVTAGPDQAVCQGSDVFLAQAAIGGSATSVTWSGGAGTFIPTNNTLNAIYQPAPSEAGSTVVLTVTSNDPPGPCGPVSDQIAIYIEPAPVVSAGLDKTICEGDVISLADASISGSAVTAVWSGGSGTFLPDNTTINAIYAPAPAEVGTTVTLTLTSNDPPGPCPAIFDQVNISINKAPEVFAGADRSICEGFSVLIGDATIGGAATSVTWSGGLGSFLPNANTLNATYVPDATEVGSLVSLTLSTNNPPGPCPAATDVVEIAVYQAATVFAGLDQNICEGTPAVLSEASVGGSAASATWSGGLGSYLPSATALNATYVPAASEIGTTVNLTLTTNTPPPGVCPAVSSQMRITFNRAATVDAGSDTLQACETASPVLNGSIGGSAFTGTWTTTGDGSFSFPGNLNASYFPGPLDRQNGGAILTLTTNNPSGPCPAVSDQVRLLLDPAAIAIPGVYDPICLRDTVQLSGAIGGAATSATWLGGFGTFINPDQLDAGYIPNTIEAGTDVVLVLRTDDPPGLCPADVKTTTIRINDLPQVFLAGLEDQYQLGAPPDTLDGFPAGGVFSGPGMVGRAFVADVAGTGTHQIVYTYTDLNGCTGFDDDFTAVVPPPDILIPVPGPYCVNVQVTDADSLPRYNINRSFDVWTGNNVFSKLVNGVTQYYFNWQLAGVGQHNLSYIFEDLVGARDTVRVRVTVNPAPVAAFQQLDFCVAEDIRFIDNSTVNPYNNSSINQWLWTFRNGRAESSAINPVFRYIQHRTDTVQLVVRTNNGCSDTLRRFDIRVGAVPEANFIYRDVAFGSQTQFESTTLVPIDANDPTTGLSLIQWNFGDPASGGANNGIGAQVQHLFTSVGTFPVTLNVETNLGCSDVLVKNITILRTIESFPSLLTFDLEEDGVSGAAGPNNSWRVEKPQGAVINTDGSGDRVWITSGNGGVYFPDERSYVELPFYQLRDLNRPMLRADFWRHSEAQRDGAVIQYRIVGEDLWRALVDTDEKLGVNWCYPGVKGDRGIIGRPGIISGDAENPAQYGWAGIDEDWFDVRYPLDAVRDEAIAKGNGTVQFRIAFGSDGGNFDPGLEGFAFDNFFIGERERRVVAEHFTNLANTGFSSVTIPLANLMMGELSDDVTLLQYHTQVPTPDSIYLNNINAPNTRGTIYNLSQQPRTFLDGYLSFSNNQPVLDYHILNQALLDPGFGILIDTIPTGEGNLLRLALSITSRTAINEDVRVFAVIVEDDIFVNSTLGALRNVVKAMLPNTGGKAETGPWNEGSTRTFNFEWRLDGFRIYDKNNLSVVVFVQSSISQGGTANIIYQSASLKLPPKQPDPITGLEEQLEQLLRTTQIFPNPSKNYFYVQFDRELQSELKWKILNQNGVEVGGGLFPPGINQFEIDARILPNGLYLMLISDGNRAYYQQKIMILR
jgi:hypothetical protein